MNAKTSSLKKKNSVFQRLDYESLKGKFRENDDAMPKNELDSAFAREEKGEKYYAVLVDSL